MTLRRWAALSVVTMVACSESTGVRGTGLQMSASVSRTSIQVGEETELTVTLANPTGAPITLHFASPCYILPYVRNLAGMIVMPGGGGWTCVQSIGGELTIGSGATKTFTFGWSGGSDLASEMPQAGSLPAGDYYFYVTMTADEGTYNTPRFLIHLR